MSKLLEVVGFDKVVRAFRILKENGGLRNSLFKLYRYEKTEPEEHLCDYITLIRMLFVDAKINYSACRFDTLKMGTHVGTDKYGNKYFHNDYYFYGRSRWVEYAPHFHMNYDGSQIPVEWFGWMHYKVILVAQVSAVDGK